MSVNYAKSGTELERTAINSLDVRRANGNTWLAEMLTGIVPWQEPAI